MYFKGNEENREIAYFENFDLDSIVTPFNVDVFKKLLVESNFEKSKTEKVIDGFRNGFKLEYDGPEDIQLRAPNLKFREVGDEITLWNKVMKEVNLKRYAGPFAEIPFKNYIQSPIGLVPKDNGKDTRLIFHLSYPRGSKKLSVNANIPTEKSTVSYPDFDTAIRLCLEAGKNCKLSRSDIRSAFRNLDMRKLDWKYLIMKARSPFDHKWYYFVDKCLPFGASISCAHFQLVSDAIAHVVKFRTKKELVNCLDDFLFVALLRYMCERQLNIFLEVCKEINFPVSEEKTFHAATCMIFLGLLIDTIARTVSIPIEKIEKTRNLNQEILAKPSKKIMVKQLQQLCGLLNFLCCAILPGRAFTRQLYAHLGGTPSLAKSKLKPHHHLRISGEMHEDLRVWQTFLEHPSAFAIHSLISVEP